MDAAHARRRQVDGGGLLGFEEGADRRRIGQVQLRMGARDEFDASIARQRTGDGASDHAAMAGDVDLLECHGVCGQNLG